MLVAGGMGRRMVLLLNILSLRVMIIGPPGQQCAAEVLWV